MLQLPHFDQDLLKRMGRRKVKTLQDLFTMPAAERKEVYAFGGEQDDKVTHVKGCLLVAPSHVDTWSCQYVVMQGTSEVLLYDMCPIR